MLAWALWSLDRTREAREAAERAVALLEAGGDVRALARAHATHIRIQATAFDPQAAIDDGARALGLASGPELAETRLDVEISVAVARGHRGDAGALEELSEASREARTAGLTIQTVRAYVNLVLVAALQRRHALVDATAAEALTLFEGYQTTIPANAIELFRARSLLDRGRWEEARTIAAKDRDYAAEKAGALGIQGLIAVRRGLADGTRLLDLAWAELRAVPESSRHGLLRVASIESAWIRDDRARALRHIEDGLRSAVAARFARSAGELALWASRYAAGVDPPVEHVPEAVVYELAGDWRAAVDAWLGLAAPYEAALAALPGDDRAAREALATLHRLGAAGTIRAFTRARGEHRGRALRGPRRSTLANVAGLTRRQQEVLDQLATGATNAAIAAALHLSERTVDHHVAAILEKLGAPNRVAALEQARTRGLLSTALKDR